MGEEMLCDLFGAYGYNVITGDTAIINYIDDVNRASTESAINDLLENQSEEEGYGEDIQREKKGIFKLSDHSIVTNDEIKNNIRDLEKMNSVCDITGNEFTLNKDSNESYLDQIYNHFNKTKQSYNNPKLGDVYISKNSIRSEIRHGLSSNKVASIAAIPNVIEVILSRKEAILKGIASPFYSSLLQYLAEVVDYLCRNRGDFSKPVFLYIMNLATDMGEYTNGIGSFLSECSGTGQGSGCFMQS